jgi:hypothetical protein
MILAAERGGLLPYVRIGDIHRPYVLRMLDIGARGLIVPYIHSADEVRELVSYAKFPPVGNRGYCPNRTTGWGADEWSRDVLSYMQACNERCKVIPQCETREALDQIEEILNNTTSEWMTQNGVKGRKFVGPNGGTIFLPAAGFRWYGEFYYVGSYGYYWSSTLFENYQDNACSLYFYSRSAYWSDYYRHYEQSVRPVR